MARILVVIGPRALANRGPGGGSIRSERWARRMVHERIVEAPWSPHVVFTGHCPRSPDVWAEDVAERSERRWVGYGADGWRYANDQQPPRRWYTGEAKYMKERRFPLLRNFVLLGAALAATDPRYSGLLEGRVHDVRVLVLRCKWSPTGGSGFAMNLARGAGMNVDEVWCPDNLRGDPNGGEGPGPDDPPDAEDTERARGILQGFQRELHTWLMTKPPEHTLDAAAYDVPPAPTGHDHFVREQARRLLDDARASRELRLILAETERGFRCNVGPEARCEALAVPELSPESPIKVAAMKPPRRAKSPRKTKAPRAGQHDEVGGPTPEPSPPQP